MSLCTVTEIERDWCGHCREQEAGSVKPLGTGPTIAASYDGDCAADCGKRIREGSSITHSTEAGGWCHTSCTTRALDTSKPSDIDLS